MSLSSNKSEIIQKIKLYVSVANTAIKEGTYDDLIENNSDDPLDFLLDIIKSVVGENILESLVESALSKIIKQEKLNQFSDSIYDSIGGNLSETSLLPQSILNNGITIPIKNFDITDSFRKVNVVGSMASKNTNPFFQKMVNSVLTQPNVDVPLAGVGGANLVYTKYDEAKGEIKVTFQNVTQKSLFDLLKSSIGPLFSAQVIINEIMNLLFHNDFSRNDRQILTLIRSYTKYENKEVFKLDFKKLLDLELDTQIKGINIDTNCFRENIEITQQQIDAVITNPTVQSFNALVPELNTDITTNVKNDYHKGILKSIIEALLMIILKQPGVIFIMSLFNKILNVNTDLNRPVSTPELFERFKPIIESVFDKVYEDFFCIVFNFIKKYLIKLVTVVAIIFLKEQLQKRIQILLSLVGG